MAAVYTLSFLAVMALFAIGNLLLKVKRPKLPRPSRASYLTVIGALAAVTIAILGNARLNQTYLIVFLEYLVPTVLIVTVMLTRLKLLELTVFFIDEFRRKVGQERREAIEERNLPAARWWRRIGVRVRAVEDWLYQKIQEVSKQQIVFFTRGDSISNLNRVMQYAEDNEHTDKIKIVTVVSDSNEVPPNPKEQIQFLDKAYPDIDIEFVIEPGEFSPELIQTLSTKWNVPSNLMFIGSPGDHFLYGISELGGVRLII
ncbi:MAG: hypothetical protein KDB00_20020 [Planctomycetales bacterium]|nr:hypothetical protein [Planctomycetales bacterium]